MLTTWMAAALALGMAAAQAGDKQDVPMKKELYADEVWYKNQPGQEETFAGRLEAVPRQGGFGFGRQLPYKLVMKQGDKEDVRTVFAGSKPQLLAPYVGKTVRLTGKAVNLEVEGQVHHEIWPARLEVVPDEKKRQDSGR